MAWGYVNLASRFHISGRRTVVAATDDRLPFQPFFRAISTGVDTLPDLIGRPILGRLMKGAR